MATRRDARGPSSVAGGGGRDERPRVILIVDDHTDTREMYAEYLTAAGFTTVQATGCTDALGAVARGPIDVMILDRRLPDGDGADVIAAVRNGAGMQTLPIIVLSGKADEGTVAADRYLMKPVPPDALHAEITRLLHGRLA